MASRAPRFTLAEGLRRWVRSHLALGHNLLLASCSQALQDLAQNPKRIDAMLGMLGALRTWTRTPEYHPHVQYLVPAATSCFTCAPSLLLSGLSGMHSFYHAIAGNSLDLKGPHPAHRRCYQRSSQSLQL